MTCDRCGSARIKVIENRYLVDWVTEIFECLACGYRCVRSSFNRKETSGKGVEDAN